METRSAQGSQTALGPRAEGEQLLLLELAVRLARNAGAIQRRHYEAEHELGTKSSEADLVTEVDLACEAAIVSAIEEHRPQDSILAEEGGVRGSESAERCWIIDPLDGTVNYAHGFPRFCVSIGIEHGDETEIGVVFDPLLDELYVALRGAGAWLNGRRLEVSREPQLDRSMLATGFGYDVRCSDIDNVANFTRMLKTARALRRDGSAALDLCYVAAGRLDGYWELQLHPWDVAAGMLMVAEAGGRCSKLSGGPPDPSGRELLASNGHIHPAMVQVLGYTDPDSPHIGGSES